MPVRKTIAMMMAAPALLLGGCGTVNRGVESVHQPVIDRTDVAFDVATSGDRLAPGEAQRLAGWMSSLRVGYGDRVSVDDPAGPGGGVRDAVAREAARFGLLVSDDVPPTVGQIAPGTARVVISRMSASVPGCPDHSRVSGIEFNGNSWSNYGCGVNSNLAAMVARPEDLVLGQPGVGNDAAVSFKAIETLRKATPTGAAGLPAISSRSR